MISQDTLQKLLDYAQEVVKHQGDLYVKKDMDYKELLPAALLSLQEEMGELTTEIRRETGLLFSKKKAMLADKHKILLEATDVLIVTLVIMDMVREGKSLDEVIEEKIRGNHERGYGRK